MQHLNTALFDLERVDRAILTSAINKLLVHDRLPDGTAVSVAALDVAVATVTNEIPLDNLTAQIRADDATLLLLELAVLHAAAVE